MRVNVQFFAIFRDIFGTKAMEVTVKPGTTIEEVLGLVCNTEQRRGKIFDNGNLRPYVIILKNGRHIQYLGGLETALEEDDKVSIFPPIAGG
jgi:molybdopterin synthase sulfur carrier subunit